MTYKTSSKKQKEDIKGKKIVILTMWDGYLHLKLKVPSALPFPNAYHTMWGHPYGNYEGWSRHDVEGVSSEKRMFERIRKKDFDWFIMDTAGTLMYSGQGAYFKDIRKLLKESGYTLHVVKTAPTHHDGWKDNVFLAYTKTQSGTCSITSDENQSWQTLVIQTACNADKE